MKNASNDTATDAERPIPYTLVELDLDQPIAYALTELALAETTLEEPKVACG
jgi:hypothetical protein